jgi:hypothetical protein
MVSRTIAVVLVLFGLAAPAMAAEPSLVVLIGEDPELRSAVRAALSGWGILLVEEHAAEPGDGTVKSPDVRALAERHRAQTVAWIANSDGGAILYLYDARTNHIVVRRLSKSPPFDEATAASVALSIKTELRHGRFEAPKPSTNPPVHWFRVSGALGMRSTATVPRHAELRLGVGASAWTSPFAGPLRAGVGIELASGPGVPVRTPSFTGTWSETALLFVLHARMTLPASVDLGVAVGAGFDVTSLGGTIHRLQREAVERRVNGVVGAHVEVGYRLGPRVRIAVRPGVAEPLNRQAYFVDGEPVLRMGTLMLSVMAGLEVAVF